MMNRLMQQRGNLGQTERWASLLSGIGLTIASLTRGGPLSRGLTSVAGLGLIARGAAGHCGMKAAMTGQSSFTDGMREQLRHLRSGMAMTAAKEIDNMEALYTAEVQELHSAESQLHTMLQELTETLADLALNRQLRAYATELRTRREDLERILARSGVDPREHPDQAMKALLRETRKMSQVSATNLRSAALIASLQRLIHYKIAGYGTVATYAQTLGRTEDAARLADYADRDKAVDQELTVLAKEFANPKAYVQPETGTAATGVSERPH